MINRLDEKILGSVLNISKWCDNRVYNSPKEILRNIQGGHILKNLPTTQMTLRNKFDKPHNSPC